eukprot:1186564-Prorocentrum_minimum.AAC.1
MKEMLEQKGMFEPSSQFGHVPLQPPPKLCHRAPEALWHFVGRDVRSARSKASASSGGAGEINLWDVRSALCEGERAGERKEA